MCISACIEATSRIRHERIDRIMTTDMCSISVDATVDDARFEHIAKGGTKP
jgi:hypothetical protein